MTQSVFHFPGVISEEDRKTVVTIAAEQPRRRGGVYTASGADATEDTKRRHAEVAPLEIPWLQERVWPLVRLANRAGGWNLPLKAATMWQYARYPVGGHHDWHEDTEPAAFADRQGGLERKITISLRLSPDEAYEGGVFELEGPHQGRLEAPLEALGDAIIFPAALRHRVTTVTRGQRESLVMWVLGPRGG